MTVVAWADCFNDNYPTTNFNEERRKALVERVKKRKYNFSYQALSMNPYSTPVFNDGTKCLLTKTEWDNVLADAYADQGLPQRCSPLDVLTIKHNDALWEKEKFITDGGQENG